MVNWRYPEIKVSRWIDNGEEVDRVTDGWKNKQPRYDQFIVYSTDVTGIYTYIGAYT